MAAKRRFRILGFHDGVPVLTALSGATHTLDLFNESVGYQTRLRVTFGGVVVTDAGTEFTATALAVGFPQSFTGHLRPDGTGSLLEA